jgi:hypothetical protein
VYEVVTRQAFLICGTIISSFVASKADVLSKPFLIVKVAPIVVIALTGSGFGSPVLASITVGMF